MWEADGRKHAKLNIVSTVLDLKAFTFAGLAEIVLVYMARKLTGSNFCHSIWQLCQESKNIFVRLKEKETGIWLMPGPHGDKWMSYE